MKTSCVLSVFTAIWSDSIMAQPPEKYTLPSPVFHGDMSLEQSLSRRRSVRQFQQQTLSLSQLARLLWAAQGISSDNGMRTAPSAGALYPLVVYVAVGRVEELPAGIYQYLPVTHELVQAVNGDQRGALSRHALYQAWVAEAPAVVVITADYDRTTAKYGQRGERYVHMEVGHAAQNLLLQATALNLGAVSVGAFKDRAIAGLLHLHDTHHPLMLVPVGH
jgi:SagB-type dehydrogenase family enzyme